jgi:cytochrome P450
MALKETMRRVPPAPILYREVRKSFVLEHHELAQDSAVWVCPQLLHHDGRNFPQPERFLPERFAPEQEKRIPEYAYLPFGAGPRTCVARHLAMMQLSVIAGLLTPSFELYPLSTTADSDWFELRRRPARLTEGG